MSSLAVNASAQQPWGRAWSPFVPAALVRQDRETFPLALFKFCDALERCLQRELHILDISTWKMEEQVAWQRTHPAQLLQCF